MPVLGNAPWWHCLHCGCGEYEEHVFTGHMKGVPMIHCANCKVLHSPPDPDGKPALRWRIKQLTEALSALLTGSLAIAKHFKIDVAAEMVRDPQSPFALAINALASCDTHPKDGDVEQAPLVSGAVPEGQTPGSSSNHSIEIEE